MSRYKLEAPGAEGEPREGGWPAVERLLRFATGSYDGPEPVEIPEEFIEWHRTLLPAAGVGALLGVAQKWPEAAHRARVESYGPPPRHSVALERLFRCTDAGVRSGLVLGSLGAVYWTVHALSAVYRGERRFVADGFNGGLAVGAIYAARAASKAPTWPPPASLQLPGRVAVIIGVGTLQGVLESWYHRQKAAEAAAAAAEADKRRKEAKVAEGMKRDAASALLAQLQASLSSPGAVQQQPEEQQQAGQDGQGQQAEAEQQQAEPSAAQQLKEEQQQDAAGAVQQDAAAAEQQAAPAAQQRSRWRFW